MKTHRIFGRDYASGWDAIVIGAGIGGLFCANLLARGGLKVLLLERHYMLGGFCSSFRRKGFLFDAATHFYPLVGNPETLPGRVLRELEIPTEWIKMDPVDQFHLPGMPVFAVPADFDRYLHQLKSWFPAESAAIDTFFADARRAYFHGLLYYFKGVSSARAVEWKDCTVTAKLDEYFRDPRLKTVLIADSPHWGSSATRTSYLFDAMLRFAYFLGNFYPRGSSQAFADDLGRALIARGGQILKCAAVERVLIRDGKAHGVKVRTVSRGPAQEFQFDAPVIVSNADAVHTYRDLIGPEHSDVQYVEHLQSLTPTAPCFLVHLGLKGMSPERLAAAAGYYWSALDPDDALRNVFKLFVPTQYDPSLAPPGCQILIVQKLTPVNWDKVTDWRAHRDQVHGQIMAELRKVLPEIDQHIVVNLGASAWTSHYFTGNWQGAMLGWEMSPEQLGSARLPHSTPIQNLYMTGHWTRPGGGVNPVIISAQLVAEAILNNDSSGQHLAAEFFNTHCPRKHASLGR